MSYLLHVYDFLVNDNNCDKLIHSFFLSVKLSAGVECDFGWTICYHLFPATDYVYFWKCISQPLEIYISLVPVDDRSKH